MPAMKGKSWIQWILSSLHLLFVLCDSAGLGTLGGGCRFPKNWWGSWFQSGLGDVTITDMNISHKGHCVENHRDYFLVENRQEGCQQCLLIISRHPNLLQYKESYCIGPESMQSLCSKIRVEAVLYTLVRDASTAISCPFQNAFHFIYNNNSGGICREPASYVHQCVSEAKFHFRFRRCQQTAYTFDRNMTLECLASWRDGSDDYLYGHFFTDDTSSKEERFRCFMYTALGTVLYLSTSADATCRGLRSSRDGPLVIELTEDSHGWPESVCDFPVWFNASSPWSDVSGRFQYSLKHEYFPSGGTTLNYYRTTSASSRILISFTCIHTQLGNATGGRDAFLVLTHVLDDCQPRYQCLKLQRRHFYVVQLQKSDYFTDRNHRCTDSDFADLHQSQLLVSHHVKTGSCPFEGKYGSREDEAGCRLEVTAGCETMSNLDITSSCQTQPILRLSCLLWWNEGQTLFFLTRMHPTNESDRIVCYVLNTVGSAIEIVQDRRCSAQQSTSGLEATYRFNNYLDECPVRSIHSENAIIDPEDSYPENGYRYVVSGELTNLNDLLSVQTSGNASGQSSISGQQVTRTGTGLFVFTAMFNILRNGNCRELR